MYFAPKKDMWFTVIIYGVISLMISATLTSNSIVVFILSALTIALLLWIWFGTGYRIEEGLLKIKSGPLRSKVNIAEIKKVKHTSTLLAGPALSLDRIEIHYNRYDIAIVSPKNKTEFVQALLMENNTIQGDDEFQMDRKDE